MLEDRATVVPDCVELWVGVQELVCFLECFWGVGPCSFLRVRLQSRT